MSHDRPDDPDQPDDAPPQSPPPPPPPARAPRPPAGRGAATRMGFSGEEYDRAAGWYEFVWDRAHAGGAVGRAGAAAPDSHTAFLRPFGTEAEHVLGEHCQADLDPRLTRAAESSADAGGRQSARAVARPAGLDRQGDDDGPTGAPRRRCALPAGQRRDRSRLHPPCPAARLKYTAHLRSSSTCTRSS